MRLARLKTYWQGKGFRNAREFALRLGLSPSHFSELDKRENPSRLLLALTRETDINIDWLLTGRGPMIAPPVTAAPVVEEETSAYGAAGTKRLRVISLGDDGASSECPDIAVQAPADVTDREAYAAVITGSAMARMYAAGSIIIVSPDKPLRDGAPAVVGLRDGRRFLRIASRKKGFWIFEAVNPAFAPEIHALRDVEFLHAVAWKREPD